MLGIVVVGAEDVMLEVEVEVEVGLTLVVEDVVVVLLE